MTNSEIITAAVTLLNTVVIAMMWLSDRKGKRFDRLEDSINQKFEKFENSINQKFDKIDERLEKMDQKFDKIDERFEKMDRKFDSLRQDMNNGFDSLRKEMNDGFYGLRQDMNEGLEKLDKKISHLQEDVSEIKERLSFLEAANIYTMPIEPVKENIRSRAAIEMWKRRRQKKVEKKES